jgi:hypothetical protein
LLLLEGRLLLLLLLLLLHLRLGWLGWLLGFSQLLVLAANSPQADGETGNEDGCNARSSTDACLGGGREPAAAAGVGDWVAHRPDDVHDG